MRRNERLAAEEAGISTAASIAPGGVQEEPKRPASPSPYIVGAAYDWALFLSPPAVALLLGIAISGTGFAQDRIWYAGDATTLSQLSIGIFIHAHLVAVFFRSHGNPQIFKSFPLRFTLVPIALYAAINYSLWALVCVSVLATFWDVYHSALQTFGFARMYQVKAGGDPNQGRSLDWWLNQLLYAGPILAGATMIDHFEDFSEFEAVGSAFLTSVPARMQDAQGWIARAVIGGGGLFLVYYVVAQIPQIRAGTVPVQKVFLLAATGFVSIYSWGFNSWGEAFFIMNLFHAVQYFGIVWAREGSRMVGWLGSAGESAVGKPIALLLFMGSCLAYGAFVESIDSDLRTLWTIALVVSIMHFWYDGFIWSVRKKQV